MSMHVQLSVEASALYSTVCHAEHQVSLLCSSNCLQCKLLIPPSHPSSEGCTLRCKCFEGRACTAWAAACCPVCLAPNKPGQYAAGPRSATPVIAAHPSLLAAGLGCTSLTAACRLACPTPDQWSQPVLPLLLIPKSSCCRARPAQPERWHAARPVSSPDQRG